MWREKKLVNLANCISFIRILSSNNLIKDVVVGGQKSFAKFNKKVFGAKQERFLNDRTLFSSSLLFQIDF